MLSAACFLRALIRANQYPYPIVPWNFRYYVAPFGGVLLMDSPHDQLAADLFVRPFCSPLFDRKPVLADVLALVKLSHKYGIHSLEHQSLRLLMNLVQSSSIRQHLSTVGSSTDTSCTRVAHVANVINNEELLRYVAEFYLKECAEQNRHLDAFRKIASPCLPLRFALKYCRGYPDLYSRFLYEAMVAGAAAWGEDPDIVLKQKLQLGIGSAECCIVWEATVSNWKRDVGNAVRARRYYSKSAPSCLCKYSRSGCKLTSDIMSQLITGGSLIPAYDILKKLRSILDLGSLANADYDDDGWDCRDVVKEVVVQKIEYHVSKLPQYFHLD